VLAFGPAGVLMNVAEREAVEDKLLLMCVAEIVTATV
jgi:hypothetical protein